MQPGGVVVVGNFVWIALALSGVVCGLGVVGVLVLPSHTAPAAALVCLAAFTACVWLIGGLSADFGTVTGQLLGLGIAAAAVSGGYALAAVLAEAAGKPDGLVPLPSPTGHGVALMVLACAEPQTYRVASAAAELADLAAEGSVAPSVAVSPFMFAAQKTRYRAVAGVSPSRRQVADLAERLETALADAGIDRFDVAWCDGPGNLSERVAEASAAGCDRVAVVPLAVAQSLEMQRAVQLVDRARPDESGIRIAYGAPLHGSEEIAQLIARRIAVGISDPATTGVVLVAHGQTEAREQTHAEFDAGEAAFVNRVRMTVADAGVPEEQIRVAWAEWREPNVTATVRHLAALGCERILVSPTCFPFESTVTKIDIPMGIRQSRIDPMVSVVTLSVWRDEPEVVEALRKTALEALEEVGARVSGP